MSRWLHGLNPEQVSAVRHSSGPLLILAGAGSGKTTVLVARAGRLIDEVGVLSHRICVLTFTNKAARELKGRLRNKLGEKAQGLWAGTFHSFGLQFLRKHSELAGLPKRFGVIDSSDAMAIIKELGEHINVAGKKAFEWEKVLGKISSLRTYGDGAKLSRDEYDDAAEVLMPKYLEKLKHLGVVDFDSLLLQPIELLEKHPQIRAELSEYYQHIMVDEFQDTNEMQMRLIRLILGAHNNIGVVGDDDQSIYGWRGAEVQNILGFPRSFPGCEVVRLERNYRSTPEIIQLANSVIVKNKDRHDKKLKPANGKGELPEIFVFENEDDECEGVLRDLQSFHRQGLKRSETAILYRSNGQSALFEAEMRKAGVPYRVSGGTAFFDRKEAKDLLAYLRCSLRPNEIAFRRILNFPPRGIGGTSIERAEKLAASENISFYKAICRWRAAGINDNTGASIEQFLATLSELSRKLTDPVDQRTAGAILLEEIEALGVRSYIQQTSKNGEVFQKRWSFIEIFCQVLDRYMVKGGRSAKSLREFVEAMELRDTEDEEKKDEVQLMTLHASKGLEFPVVFLVGVEEDLLPHRTLGSDVSEERRLFYVGVTRAQKRLILSRARERKRYGRLKPSAPSRFLLEIPENLARTYERGLRPVDEKQRQVQLEDLYAQLDSIAQEQRLK